MSPRPRPPMERFMEKTVRESTCLRWTGARDKDGYPMFALSRAKSVVRGTRWLWEQVRGPIPPGPDGQPLFVCHTCDHPWCVEIEHMWLGTTEENTADRITKGRRIRVGHRDRDPLGRFVPA